ncbi:MAG: hypothetical protein EOP07_14310 [Proteobacteria bacterium]|nr:MAG: hypothetical protein EOP07_14310 [Pseudomonadota bacterium]
MKILFLAIISLLLNACQTGFVPISQRNLYEKEGKSANLGHRRPIEERATPGSEVYLKRENIEIVPQETKNYTGSLLTLKNPDTYLFTDAPRGELGEFLDVFVTVNRSEKPATPAAAPADPAAKGKAVQDELIAALPKLEPAIADAKMPSLIKMKVVRKMENGDIIVEAARASQNEWEANSQRATARIPHAKITGRADISTADLADVHWSESVNGTMTERESNTWEDEYSMRWAGFDEARSKVALDLENKRKDLEKVKDRLKDKIVNVGRERNKLAAEKDKVDVLRREAEDKLNDLSQKNSQQDALIEQQKDIIKKQEQIIEEARNNNQANLVAPEKVADPKAKDAKTPAAQ